VLRRLVVPIFVALLGATACAWSELLGFAWSDYETANQQPFRALVHGHFASFLHLSPIDGPSLLVRAPFAFAAWAWGGSDMAIYRMVAVPGLLAGAIFGVVLWLERQRLHPAASWGLPIVVLAAANPVTLTALRIGHPEELMGAVFCAAAVLAAQRDRPWLAAVLLGVAMGNKAWAVIAIGPVLLSLDRKRLPVLLASCGIAALLVAPFLLASAESRAAVSTASQTYGVFRPPQIWWFLGDHSHVVHGMFGNLLEGYRVAPAWIGPITHPLIVALAVGLPLLWWRRHGAGKRGADPMLLLALLLLLRCTLDAANNAYYHLPFLMALLAWEALQRKEPPVFSLLAAALVWLTAEKLPQTVSADAQSLVYLAWALPALALLTWVAFRRPAEAHARRAAVPAGALAPVTAR
jgi:uncharacterized membrane protein (UPF0136 family)